MRSGLLAWHQYFQQCILRGVSRDMLLPIHDSDSNQQVLNVFLWFQRVTLIVLTHHT